jgi:uncharacterized protein YuzE
MRLKVDKENDALYFRLNELAIVESEEVRPGLILDFDAEGRVVGIEILHGPKTARRRITRGWFREETTPLSPFSQRERRQVSSDLPE